MSDKITSGLLTIFSIAFFSLAINPSPQEEDHSPIRQECALGEILIFAGDFAPFDWEFCAGQMLNINQYQALFSILGTQYGGDGRTTFALPDLRGRAAVNVESGRYYYNNIINKLTGDKMGSPFNHLTTKNIPLELRNGELPIFDIPAGTKATNLINGNKSVLASANTSTTNISGNAQVNPQGYHRDYDNHSPSLSVNYLICTSGTYPSRS